MNAEFLKLIESLAATITPTNIESAAAMIENLIALAEKLEQDLANKKF